MENLIKALQIMLKYGNPVYPTYCEHDCLWVDCNPSLVSEEDKAELDTLGFFADEDDNCFKSYKFGSN